MSARSGRTNASYMDNDAQREVVVWVPVGRAAAAIRRGSAVVSSEPADADGRVVVDVEGNLYGSVGMEVFANRVLHAWGRQKERYPTVARMAVPVDSLQRVGVFDVAAGRVRLDDAFVVQGNRSVLATWLGKTEVDDAELVATAGRYA